MPCLVFVALVGLSQASFSLDNIMGKDEEKLVTSFVSLKGQQPTYHRFSSERCWRRQANQ